jgi:hypothetical protein
VFVLATAVLRSVDRMTERSSLQDLNLPLLLARAKQHRSAEQMKAIPLVQTKLANPRLKAKHFAALRAD